SASAALEKIAAVLDTDPEVVEPEQPRSLPARGKETAEAASTGAGPQPGRGRTLGLAAVRVAYADGPDVLPRFALHSPAGQIVALVGATGAGKSTLVKRATRFYDPSAGRISLDEVDLRDRDDGQ